MAKKKNKKLNVKAPKVLFVATVDVHILNFHLPYLKLFKDKGYEVHVATNGNEKIPYCDKKHIIPFERSPFKTNNLRAIKQLKQIIDKEKFEIIHCHTPMGSVITRIAAMKARKNGTRVIYTAHGFHFYKGAPIKNWLVYYPVEKFLSRYTDTLITINEEDYNLAKKKFHARQTELVHGVGVDPEKFNFEMTEQEKDELRKQVGVNKDDFVMICVGELNDNKNQIMQIEAMRELVKKNNKIKLILAGEGDKKKFLEQKIEEYNLQGNVKLLGYRTDIPKLLKISNLALSTSKREGLPVNVIEALMSGIPVIGTDTRGTRDLIQDGVNGYIVKEYNLTNYINMISQIKSFDISQEYSVNNIRKYMSAIYDKPSIKRILHVVGSMNMGGAENFIMNMYRNIDRTKFQFDFIVHKDGTFDNEIKELGGKIYKIDYVSKTGPIRYKMQLRKFLKSHPEYNIIHSHVDQTSGIVLDVAKHCNVKLRISHSHSTSNSNNFIVRVYKKVLQKRIKKYATIKLACSESAGKWLYGNEKFTVINNGIDISKFTYNEVVRKLMREKYNLDEKTIIIGQVGRFSEVKNHEFLISIFSDYLKNNAKSKLILIGDGELKNKIENLVSKLNIMDKVIFAGIQKSTSEFYSMMDVIAMPSLYEGIPLTLIEAQANGLKVIASDKVDTSVKINKNVEFVPLTDQGRWLEKFETLKLRDNININTKINEYDIKKIVYKYLKIIGVN